MNTRSKTVRFIQHFSLMTVFALVLTLVMQTYIAPSTYASLATEWKAGNIMSDAIMTNDSSMSVNAIQSFLNSKVSKCDTNGTQLSEFGGPDLNGDGKVQRWEWGKSKYNQTKFPCLKDYKVGDKSAARVIYEKAQKYSINPQVLIVLLQKEQSLVTDTWPLNVQYKAATGYGCPDTAPCASQYFGLSNQLDWAAKMFRAILDDSPNWYTPYELGNNYIQYNPSSSCDGKTVNIQNRATQALYNYTPYQPNKAALNAGWGSASCGAYGNRNFYLYFKSWFGDPRAIIFSAMNESRYLRLETDLQKTNLRTGEADGVVLRKGMEIYFTTSYRYEDELYVRTEADTSKKLERGIRYTDLTSLLGIKSMSYSRYMLLKNDLRKTNLRTGDYDGALLQKGMSIYFTDKYEYDGQLYLRTRADSSQWFERGVRYTDLLEPLIFSPMKDSRYLRLKSDLRKTNLQSGDYDGALLQKGMSIYFTDKYEYDGQLYLRTRADSIDSTERAIPYAKLSE